MHLRGRWRVQRWLAALLCLLASFAYLNREPDGARTPGTSVSARMASMPMSEARAQAETPPTAPEVQGTAPPCAHDPAPRAPALDHGGPNAPPHDHAAHCPFCFTAAFALEAPGVALPAPEGARLERPLPARPEHTPRVQTHADARAPPLAGA